MHRCSMGAGRRSFLYVSKPGGILERLHSPRGAQRLRVLNRETDQRASLIESKFTLASDSEATYREWRKIVVAEGVSGIQVHDARLVAAMRVHGIEHLLTLNVGDFRRYEKVIAVSPQDLLAQIG